ncbi:MAG: Ig-like domain-containing protein [Anaerolineales bacterium]
MRTKKRIGYGLILVVALASFGLPTPSQAAPRAITESQSLPPVLISDDTFSSFDWTVTEEVFGNGSSTVNQQLSGGNPGAFRFMSHRLPPVSGSGGNTIFVTHIHKFRFYHPRLQGVLRAIDYRESGIVLSFPFPEAFSTTQPVVVQDGRTYRSPKFLRFVAQNSSHAWETKALLQLTAADFIRVGGSENDHPDFSASGDTIQFGFTRINSRSSTLPPVPGNQDMVIDQGVDNWQVTVYRDNTNQPPQAVDDVFIVDGHRGLPLSEYFYVLANDSDPDPDPFHRLELTEVTTPANGSASLYSIYAIYYRLDQPRYSDAFRYTVSDGNLTSSARVDVYVDCGCTLNCLGIRRPENLSTQATDNIDLPLIYRVRDQILKPTPDGRRYVDMYYTNNPEILINIMTNESLRAEAVATVELWQNNLRSLTDGDGSAVITQAQVDALESFLSNLSATSSAELRQLIADEVARLGPLDDYVGLTMHEAKRQVIGDPKLYLPLIVR